MDNADGLPDLDTLDLDAILEYVPTPAEFCGFLAREMADEREDAARAARAEAIRAARAASVCGRCDGKGTIAGYRHIASGLCFECNGTGIGAGGHFILAQAGVSL